MNSLSEIKTETNIINTYQSEARDREIYRAFAEKAGAEGKTQVANLFRAATVSKNILAHSVLSALREISAPTCDLWMAGGYHPGLIKESSAENLKAAIANVASDTSKMFPSMIRDAENDGWKFAKQCFTHAKAVDKGHHKLFNHAIDNLDKPVVTDYFVCESCGNVIEKKPVASCSVCGAAKKTFMIVT